MSSLSPQRSSAESSMNRTRRSMYVQSPENMACVVSRQSGLRANVGTFGGQSRFGKRLMGGTGNDSPWGNNFFKASPFWREEPGKKAVMGQGQRPSYVRGKPNLGPGTYTPLTSTAKPASSLDGKKYCKMTIKNKTKVTVGAVNPHEEARKPGPGTYTIGSHINGHYVTRNGKINWSGPPAPKMGLALKEVSTDDGDCMYNVSQDLGAGKLMYFKDAKKSSTFGFAAGKPEAVTQSPDGDLYYSHVKMVADYTKVGRAAGLGFGNRPMLADEQTTAGPGSYFPVASTAKTTSPLDGFSMRNLSPITQFGKTSSLKMRSMTSVSPQH
ncbi:unnamed protein product [Amoebophrya sp. A25]|nr:unnamed protein product [Amoebophrya sp. A25]|eukprot:GSA25T00014822001.1